MIGHRHFAWLDEDRGYTACGRSASLVTTTSDLDRVECKTCRRSVEAELERSDADRG